MRCPKCRSTKVQVKNGLNKSGSQKYRCQACGSVYTPEPRRNGYPDELRLLAIRMYVEGNSYNRVWSIGSSSTQRNCQLLPYPANPKLPNWMNSTRSLARKKRSLHPNRSRSDHSLCVELGCSTRTDRRSHASLSGASSSSQAVLLRCFSSL
jgi:hypothetical protein